MRSTEAAASPPREVALGQAAPRPPIAEPHEATE